MLGKLFKRSEISSDSTQEATLHDPASDAIIRSRGRALVDGYWGRYIAFLRDPDTRTCWIVRDPTGAIPCLSTNIHGVDIYFLRLEDCERIPSATFTVNRDYFLGQFLGNAGFVRQTGLQEVENVLAGECVEHDGESKNRFFHWNPFWFVESPMLEDFSDAKQQVYHTLSACIFAWASCFDHIALRLSGGLDSSVVLACLARAPNRPALLCQNDYSPGSRSDERTFARLVARGKGCQLIERKLKSNFSLEHLLQTPRSVSPLFRTFDAQTVHTTMQEFRSKGVTAIFEGHGGDEIFYKSAYLPTAADYAWSHGVSPRLLNVAYEDAIRSQISLWTTLRRTIRHGLLRRPWQLQKIYSGDFHPLVSKELKLKAAGQFESWHPLFRDPSAVPPGKIWHAYGMTSHSAIGWQPDAADDFPIHISPMLSQPIMELSLQIPTYVHSRGGRDRAVLRAAFEDDLPREIILRKSKGTEDESLLTLIFNNIAVVRALLLEGYLVREGILQRADLEEVLSGQPTRLKGYLVDIFDYLNIEAWARNWMGKPEMKAVM